MPSGVTNVEVRAVRDATRNAGAREVYIVEEPMAGAIGIRLPIHEPVGSMVIDIGGGTTDIAVISLGGIVRSKNLKIAGDRLNNDIISYIRNEFKILIGEKTAEDIKIVRRRRRAAAKPLETTDPRPRPHHRTCRARSSSPIPTSAKPWAQSIDVLVEATREVLETTPPEILSDVMRRGVHIWSAAARSSRALTSSSRRRSRSRSISPTIL